MSTEQNHTAVAPGKYTIIWKFMPEGWADGLSSELAPGTMPYFLDGESYERFKKKQGVRLTPYALLCGVLICWLDIGKLCGAEQPEPLHRFLEDLLEDLRKVFGVDSLETMILFAAADIREKHGSILASRILVAGNNVLPRSSKIRSDLIVDMWWILNSLEEVDRDSTLLFIARLYEGIESSAVDETILPLLDYAYFIALRFLGASTDRHPVFLGSRRKASTEFVAQIANVCPSGRQPSGVY